MKYISFSILAFLLFTNPVRSQVGAGGAETKDLTEQKEMPSKKEAAGKKETPKKTRILYGTASYYAEFFNGRETANGEIYDSKKMTAACNVLPLGTWIKVTNMNNNRSVIVKTNDRMHIRMKRVVDLSRAAAEKLGYIGRGLTKVKVEVLQAVDGQVIGMEK